MSYLVLIDPKNQEFPNSYHEFVFLNHHLPSNQKEPKFLMYLFDQI
jgi:hypothetical protein